MAWGRSARGLIWMISARWLALTAGSRHRRPSRTPLPHFGEAFPCSRLKPNDPLALWSAAGFCCGGGGLPATAGVASVRIDPWDRVAARVTAGHKKTMVCLRYFGACASSGTLAVAALPCPSRA